MTDALAEALAAEILGNAPFRDPGPEALPDVEAAYAVQAAVVKRLEAARGPVAGRKIAWNSAAQLSALKLTEPGAAVVLGRQVLADGAVLKAADYATFAFEPEIAAVLRAPMAPREGGHDRASAAAATARLHPAFELLDQRGFAGERPEAALAANVFNVGIVLGGPGLAPEGFDPDALRSVVTLDDAVLLDKPAAAPMHPLDAVAFLANRFNRLGVTLAAGEVLLLGAHLPPYRHPGTGRLRFACGALGSVALEIV